MSEALRRAQVSRNAYYHLTRRPTVVPRIPVGSVEVRVLPLARVIASKKATDRP